MRERIRGGAPERQRHWEVVVRGWKESGQSVREYCRAQGLQESAFYFWRRTLARHGQGDGVEEVPQAQAGARKPVPGGRKRASLPHRNGPAFLPVQVVEAGRAEANCSVEIVLARGGAPACGSRVAVRVAPGFDRQTLADVLAVLESRPC